MSRVPAEFQGMARRLRDSIVATDVLVRDVSERIRRDINKRFERHLTLRPEALIDIERDWKTNMPTFGRINQKTTREKKSLRIDEIRVVKSEGRFESWDGDKELGVIVARISLTIARVGTGLTQTPLAMVSLHALSRRFQRAFNVTDDDAIADLHPLAITVGRETVGIEFGYPVRDGDWKGVVVNYKEHDEEFTVLAVRTFRGDSVNIRRGMFRVWVCAVAFSASSHAADKDQLLQDRYHLCMDYADARWLEEFRGRCDVLCIDSKNGTWDECLALHDKWDTSSCYLPDAERDRQDRHLEHDKDRCLQEFKAGNTTSPYSHSGEKLEDEEP